jgi:protein-tyrosine phosphatase
MRSILFVCTANVCRSPTAAGVLRTLLGASGTRGIEIASAGTHDYQDGNPPSSDAVEAARSRGYDITGNLARRVRAGDFDHFDLILAMDKANLSNLRGMAPTRTKQKIELLLEYGDRYYGQEVPDPFGGKPEGFELALDMIEDGCRGLAKVIDIQHPARGANT